MGVGTGHSLRGWSSGLLYVSRLLWPVYTRLTPVQGAWTSLARKSGAAWGKKEI